MKKLLKILASLLLLTVLFLAYQVLNSRKACQWKTAYNPDESKSNEKKNHKNLLRQILFLNDIYRNYDSFSPSEHDSPVNKYSACLSGLSVLKGEKKQKNKDLVIVGREIVIAAWKPGELIKRNHLDLLELELRTSRNIGIEVLAVQETRGILNKLITSVSENIFRRIPAGVSLYKTALQADKERQFQRISIDLSKEFNEGNKNDGILIKINPRGKKKKVRVKIRNLHLLNREFKIIEDMPQLDYFKYGGVKRRLIESIFLRAGSTLTYSVSISKKNDPGKHPHRTIYLDGYLGSIGKKPLTFKISVNESDKPLVLKKVSKGVHYFRSAVEPLKGNLKLKISVEGERGGTGALGNLSLYRTFKEKEKRNVVLYLIDALRADKCGIKQKVFETGFKNGAVFASAYANATQTADSLPTLFSGKYKFTLVEKNEELPYVSEKEFLLAEYFKSRGYTTAAFINNPWLHRSNASQGFDFINHCWKHVKQASAFPSGEDYVNLKYGEMETYLDEFVQKNKNKPLFVFIHTMEPHVPYEPPEKMRKYSADADPGILNTLFQKVTQSPSYPILTDPDAKQLTVLKSLYKDQILIADDFFKRIYNYLETESVLNPSSLLILTSDHGERFYEHKSWIHGPPDVYNEVLRIPLMIKGPGIISGTYNKNVQLVDIYPTIIDWFGARAAGAFFPHPTGLAGNSLIDKKVTFNHRVIYADGTGKAPQFAFIKDKMKVVVDGDKIEVFDLERDPGETANLSKDLRHKGLISAAKAFRKRFKIDAGKEKKKRRDISEAERRRLKTLGYVD